MEDIYYSFIGEKKQYKKLRLFIIILYFYFK